MDRLLSRVLEDWSNDPARRPLVLRGARQVGKTWLARELAGRIGRTLAEVNFERHPRLAAAFEARDPKRILADLGLALDLEIGPDRSLLFLDEIQAAAPVLPGLRWFAEELPELPVIAAGSLLDFALAEEGTSVPVGRIAYRHVEPMSFVEYLGAHGQAKLVERLGAWRPGQPLDSVAHDRASELYERFGMVGGLPGVVSADVGGADARQCRRLQVDLLATYRDDFAKYAGRMAPSLLDSTLSSVAAQLGGKFVYARVGDGVKQHQAKQCVELLARARLITLVTHSLVSGIPIGGEVKARNRKALFLDVGLAHAAFGTPAGGGFPRLRDLAPFLRGKLAEQLAGQQLRVVRPGSGDEPVLHYWQREGGRPGEIDFLLQIEQRIVPVELKSGAAGAMKSLHQFMVDKSLDFAVRIDANPPSLQNLDVKTTKGDRSRYRLLSVPGYLIWRLAELVGELTA